MKFLKRLIIVIVAILLVLFVINLFDYSDVTADNKWVTGNNTLISAHRGGAELNPENTKMAFDYAINEVDYIDIVELDVRTTKDEQIVIVHDETINRVALDENDEKVFINEKTKAQLEEYNLGKNFVNREGDKPYSGLTISEAKNKGLTIITLEEFLSLYSEKNFRLFIEIKEKNELGKQAADKVITLLNETRFSKIRENTLIISFADEVMDYIGEKYQDVQTGPLGYKIVGFLATSIFRVNLFYKPDYICLQVQPKQKIGPLKINLATKTIIDSAHKRNMAVTYWTVNDEDMMNKLIDMGADIITTNAPDKLYDVLLNRGLR